MKGEQRIRNTYLKLRRAFRPGAVILLYHRVANLPDDPYSLAVTPAHFARHLEHIRRECRPMRLLDLVEASKANSLPKRAVAITFDDGYVDNFELAYPILGSFGVPATIFVPSDKIDSQREFWWDELERLLLGPEQRPQQLVVSVQGEVREWHLSSEDQRHRAHEELHRILKPLDTSSRETILDELTNWAGSRQGPRRDYRAVTAAELQQLSESEHIDIGAHTISHPSLASLSPEAQSAEVVGGRQKLEAVLGRSADLFAYPYGTASDFSADTVEIVRAAGFQAACTAIPGSVEPGDDLMCLHRCGVFDWDLPTFRDQLDYYFTIRR